MALRSARGQEGSASPPPHTWRGFLAQGRSRGGRETPSGRHLGRRVFQKEVGHRPPAPGPPLGTGVSPAYMPSSPKEGEEVATAWRPCCLRVPDQLTEGGPDALTSEPHG